MNDKLDDGTRVIQNGSCSVNVISRAHSWYLHAKAYKCALKKEGRKQEEAASPSMGEIKWQLSRDKATVHLVRLQSTFHGEGEPGEGPLLKLHRLAVISRYMEILFLSSS